MVDERSLGSYELDHSSVVVPPLEGFGGGGGVCRDVGAVCAVCAVCASSH